MRVSEKILLLFCNKNEGEDCHSEVEGGNSGDGLRLLRRCFPDFTGRISGKEIVDYGCGNGLQCVAMAKNGAKFVLGIDTNPQCLKKARDLARKAGVEKQVVFTDKLEDYHNKRYDVIISQNSMEHFSEPAKILADMKGALKHNGSILITFGPPWFAPYGSHMHFFVRIPWVNLIFSERTVMNVRARFRNDGALKYEEVESGLNKMSVAKFERICRSIGMKIGYKKYECVKGINFLGKIPLIRELFVNRISCVLTMY